MNATDEMVTLHRVGYTTDEVTRLSTYIHDGLWNGGIRVSSGDLYKLAVLTSRFATTREEWERGRKDLKELGTFIALVTIEYIKGIE